MKKVIVWVVILAVCIFLLAFVSEYQWNNGICRECGEGHYNFTNASHSKHLNHYYYECDNCGHVIMTYWTMD